MVVTSATSRRDENSRRTSSIREDREAPSGASLLARTYCRYLRRITNEGVTNERETEGVRRGGERTPVGRSNTVQAQRGRAEQKVLKGVFCCWDHLLIDEGTRLLPLLLP